MAGHAPPPPPSAPRWHSAPGVDSHGVLGRSIDIPRSSTAAPVIALQNRPAAPVDNPVDTQLLDQPATDPSLAAAVPPPDDAHAELAPSQVRFDQVIPHTQGRRPLPQAAESSFARSVRSWEPVSDVESSSFAGRFACDFQSFDEDTPWRRAEVLREVLADTQACTWGWSGAGRQRADSPLPGRIYRRSDTVVFVEVVVRVTPYVRAAAASDPEDYPELAEPPGTVGRSCAPPESDAAWTAGEPRWVRMTVPVTRAPADGRLVVDPGLLSGPAAGEAGDR